MSAAAGAGVLAVAHARSSFMSGILIDVLAVRLGFDKWVKCIGWYKQMILYDGR